MDFVKLLERDPQNPSIYSNVGLVFRKLGEYEKACDMYTKEIEFNPQNCFGYNKRAFCMAKLGEFEEAIKDYCYSLKISS